MAVIFPVCYKHLNNLKIQYYTHLQIFIYLFIFILDSSGECSHNCLFKKLN